MSPRRWLSALTLAALLVGGNVAFAQLVEKKAPKEVASFGTLRATSPEAARGQAQDWLKGVGKTDEATTKAFNAIWDADRPMVDKVGDTLALGSDEAKKLLDAARDPAAPAPTAVPAVLKDAKQAPFLRNNLALVYAKALSGKRVFEESLEALKAGRAEMVVDPATFLFNKAVAEYSLLLKKEANDSIVRLLDDVVDAPERYKTVAALMHFDMLSWRDKDLAWIARKMDNIERRLELARGGQQTQKMQKEVVARLDELIKELENKKCGNCNCNGGGCPNGGNAGGARPSSPMQDSNVATNSGPGNVDPKRLRELAEVWGKLPEKERAKAMLELQRDLPPRYREVIENYFKKLAQNEQASK